MRVVIRIVLAVLTVLALAHATHGWRPRAGAMPVTAAGCTVALQ